MTFDPRVIESINSFYERVMDGAVIVIVRAGHRCAVGEIQGTGADDVRAMAHCLAEGFADADTASGSEKDAIAAR